MHLPGLNDIIWNHTIFPSPVTSPGVQVFSLFLKMLDTKPQKASKVASTSLWDPFFPLLLNHRTAFRSSNGKDFVWFVKEPVDETQTQPLFLKLKIKSENSLHIFSFFWQLPRYSSWASATITWRRKKKKVKTRGGRGRRVFKPASLSCHLQPNEILAAYLVNKSTSSWLWKQEAVQKADFLKTNSDKN